MEDPLAQSPANREREALEQEALERAALEGARQGQEPAGWEAEELELAETG